MAVVSRSTNAPPRAPSRLPQILAPVGLRDEGPALLPRESDRRLGALLDRLAADVVLRHATGRRVLDLGRGAPQVADWVADRVDRLTVVDAVDLGRGATIRLPLPDAAFDCVYSLRTLPHLGHDRASSEAALGSALEELGRVLAPGGVAVLELANARSPIGLLYGLRELGSHLRPARDRTEHGLDGPLVIDSPRGLTRLDVLSRVVERLPATLVPIDLHGVRVVVASPHLLAVPLLGRVLARLEWLLRDQPLIRRLAAHLLLVLRRSSSPDASAPDPGGPGGDRPAALVAGPKPPPPRA
jgi:SAM-dependent methyltransferase